jgi:hypothetical protein
VRRSAVRRLEVLERRLHVLALPSADEIAAADERETIRARHMLFSMAAQLHPELTPEPLPPEFAESAARDRAILAELCGGSAAKAKREILARLARYEVRALCGVTTDGHLIVGDAGTSPAHSGYHAEPLSLVRNAQLDRS